MSNTKKLVPVDQEPIERQPYSIAGYDELREDLNWASQKQEEAANERTTRTHEAGWNKWIRFCQHRNYPLMPVPPVAIVGYIRWLTEEHGHALNTISTYLTSISVAYRDVWNANGVDERESKFFAYLESRTPKAQGLSPEAEDEPQAQDDDENGLVVSPVKIQQARNASAREMDAGRWIDPTRGAKVRELRTSLPKTDAFKDKETNKRAPVLLKHLLAMDFDEDSTSDLRDRALLYVGYAGGFRRSELVALRVEDVLEVPGGHRIVVPHSKTDQEGKGMYKEFQETLDWPVHPIDALFAWLNAAGIESGPVFRAVDRWGNVKEKSMSGHSAYRIVRKWMESIGEDPSEYGAHSLRAGHVSDAKTGGAPEDAIMRQTGHKSAGVMRGYDRYTGIRAETNSLSYITP